MSKKQTTTPPISRDEALVLAAFLDIAQEGEEPLAQYLNHCGIDPNDIRVAGDVRAAILRHYQLPSGAYDIDAVAHDLLRWPPIAKCIKEAKRAKWTAKNQSRDP